MLKRLVILLVTLYCMPFAYAQDQRALRVGIGVNVRDNYPNATSLKVGPSIFAEYERCITNHIAIGVNLHFDISEYGSDHSLNDVGISFRGIYTPFPDRFGRFKLGVGATYEYRQNFHQPNLSDDQTAARYKNTEHLWGFDFPIRFYLLESNRYEVFAFYELKTMITGGSYIWNYSNGGITFGVKF